MPSIEVKVSISIDGRFVPGFDPYVRRLEVDEASTNRFQLADSGVLPLPPSVINTRQLTAFKTDQVLTVEFNQTGGNPDVVDVAAGGIVLVIGSQHVANSVTATVLNNDSGEDAVIDAVVGGTG